MDERQRPTRLEDARRRQHVGGVGGLDLVEVRESRSLEQVAPLEHGDGAREPAGRLGEPVEPEPNRSADRFRADSLDVGCEVRVRRDALLAERVDELAQEERRPSRRPQAGVDELRLGPLAERRLDELLDGGSRQRRKPNHFGRRIGRQRREQLGVGAALVRTRSDDERDVELFEPGEQEREVAERRRVGPVRIVDDQAQRTVGRQVRAQPVQAVQDRKRRVDAAGGGNLVRPPGAGKPEMRGGDPGRAVEQIGSLGVVSLGERRLEELTDDTERELSLELGARARSTRISRPAATSRVAPSSAVLPIPAGPSTTRKLPRASRARRAPTRSVRAPRSARAAGFPARPRPSFPVERSAS